MPGDSTFKKAKASDNDPNIIIVSINLLPPEILLHIFRLRCKVLSARTKLCRWDVRTRHLVNTPVQLSHVCSYWRRIVTKSSSLWSHVDLYPGVSPTCLEMYTICGADTLLDVHIFLPYPGSMGSLCITTLDRFILPFLTIYGTRIRSLKFRDHGEEYSLGFYTSLFTTCFKECRSGVLTELSIEAAGHFRLDERIIPYEYQVESSLTWSVIESLWLSVKALRLTDCQVEWNSKIYHGLSELRLTCCRDLTTSVLASIFQLSPHLRIFELDHYDASTSEGLVSAPVQLIDLQVLILESIDDKALGSVLKLIAPGSKPLSLAIQSPYQRSPTSYSLGELQRFASRSNVTNLWVNYIMDYFQIIGILSLMPTVRALTLRNPSCKVIQEPVDQSTTFKLDSLHILAPVFFDWSIIGRLVQIHKVQRLMLWRYYSPYNKVINTDGEKIPDDFSTFDSMVTIVPDNDLSPIREWPYDGW